MDPFIEQELEAEWMAQFDEQRERYAATLEDIRLEGIVAQQEAEEADRLWQMRQARRGNRRPDPAPAPEPVDPDDLPF